MSTEENKEDNRDKANEPLSAYGNSPIMFFKTAEEQADYERKKMASLSHRELMINLEKMRKFFLRAYLLPNGDWPPIEKVITICKPKCNE